MVDKTGYKVFNLFTKGYVTLVSFLLSIRQNGHKVFNLFAKGYVTLVSVLLSIRQNWIQSVQSIRQGVCDTCHCFVVYKTKLDTKCSIYSPRGM